jgi:hypothetical protein
MSHTKETKAEFLRQSTSKGVRYHGSVWNKSLEECFEALEKISHPEKAEINKAEKYGAGIRRLKSDGNYSYVDLKKETKVFRSGNFWILFSSYPSTRKDLDQQTCAVAYSIK